MLCASILFGVNAAANGREGNAAAYASSTTHTSSNRMDNLPQTSNSKNHKVSLRKQETSTPTPLPEQLELTQGRTQPLPLCPSTPYSLPPTPHPLPPTPNLYQHTVHCKLLNVNALLLAATPLTAATLTASCDSHRNASQAGAERLSEYAEGLGLGPEWEGEMLHLPAVPDTPPLVTSKFVS